MFTVFCASHTQCIHYAHKCSLTKNNSNELNFDFKGHKEYLLQMISYLLFTYDIHCNNILL
jgi:hypothetical protein